MLSPETYTLEYLAIHRRKVMALLCHSDNPVSLSVITRNRLYLVSKSKTGMSWYFFKTYNTSDLEQYRMIIRVLSDMYVQYDDNDLAEKYRS